MGTFQTSYVVSLCDIQNDQQKDITYGCSDMAFKPFYTKVKPTKTGITMVLWTLLNEHLPEKEYHTKDFPSLYD